MASLKDIRGRISSTKSTQKITKAMKMVSAAKLRRAQNGIVNARPYAYKLHSLISRLSESGEFSHPLMAKHADPKKLLILVLTSDRGLCGAFNGNVIKFAERYYREQLSKYEAINFIFIGRRGNDYFKRRNVNAVETIVNLATDIKYDMAAKLANQLMQEYTAGGYDEVVLIYNEFKSAISQRVTAETLLPITPLKKEDRLAEGESMGNYLFEPDANAMLQELLPKHFAVQVYRSMLESVASEHGARMSAMDSATRNAGEMIRKLTLYYNKLRQAAITKELMEIVSGAEALK